MGQVKKACEARGASVTTKAIDVRNAADIEEFMLSVDSERPLDLVFANAGYAQYPV